jgi:hypothetical protein
VITTKDGATIRNGWTGDIIMRASGETTALTVATTEEKTGFGGLKELVFELQVTAVDFTGGTTPSVILRVWIQRKTPSGAWDDLLSFATAAMSEFSDAPSAVRHVAEHRSAAPALPTPAAVQDGAGNPPYASRGGWHSDELRTKSQLVSEGGSPTARAVTWSLVARGRV